MFSKYKILLLVFTGAIIAIILTCFHSNKKYSAPYHDFLQTAEFKKMSRVDQVAKCASCHKQEFENENKGPHANAYKMLKAHRKFVNSNKYECAFYTKSVNKSFENCVGCHAPQSLFETLLHDTLNNQKKFVEELLQEPHPRPLTRTSEEARATSTDCFSCHYDGEKMISLKHIFSKEDTIPALQTVATIAANNLACYTCHFDVIRHISPQIAIARTGSVLCVNCHQEYNVQNKGTHYYYWSHDPSEKVNAKVFSVMDDFHFKLSADYKTGEIVWQNTAMPHRISPGPEMILKCEVLDKDSNLLGYKTIRINKKKEFDVEMYKNLENNTLFGEYGDEVPLDGSSIKYSMPVKNGSKAAAFRISLIHKAQYWFPDSLGELTAVKVYPVNR